MWEQLPSQFSELDVCLMPSLMVYSAGLAVRFDSRLISRVNFASITHVSGGRIALVTDYFSCAVMLQPDGNYAISMRTLINGNLDTVVFLFRTTFFNAGGITSQKTKPDMYSVLIHSMLFIYVIGTSWNNTGNPALTN